MLSKETRNLLGLELAVLFHISFSPSLGTSSMWKENDVLKKHSPAIIKGTGRFQGIKGTLTTKGKFLPLEKDEAGPK